MMGSFVTRVLLMAFCYAYPAYECFKTVEKPDPETAQIVFWCRYWILVAWLTVFERVGEILVSWLPFYGEAKLALIVYLWYPRTRGATYIYESFLQPYVVKHEKEIESTMLTMSNKVALFTALVWERALRYGQARFFEILQFVSSQSASKSAPTQESGEKGK